MKRPERVVLEGRHVKIVPLNAAAHSAALYAESKDPELWRYLSNGPFTEAADFRQCQEEREKSVDPLFFTILDAATAAPVGFCSLMRIEPAHRVIEVGHILFLPCLQRTVGATESMYLLARYVFEQLGYRRYEWKCDTWNAPSRKAALRLGFAFEGIFRQHFIIKGKNRDTAWYSMLDTEWQDRKRAFEEWLDPANFDAEGRQKRPLGRG